MKKKQKLVGKTVKNIRGKKWEKACPDCGKVKTYKNHKSLWASVKRGSRCKECSLISFKIKMTKSISYFQEKSQNIHGNNYLILRIKHSGNSKSRKMLVECKVKNHGTWWVTIANFFGNLRKCPKCNDTEKRNKERLKYSKLFVIRVKRNFGKNVDVSQANYQTARKKIKSRCTIDGHGFWWITPDNLLRGYGCPKCSTHKGVAKINKYFTGKVYYKIEKTFPTLKDILPLRYDFYIPSLNLLIEYNGPQHYKPVKWFGGIEGYEGTIRRDAIKTKWAKDNGYRLMVIKHTDYSKIEKILEKELA
jgi:predicted RNA-binding Zn-ribbon protein involved in translation (DUF1610 family)